MNAPALLRVLLVTAWTWPPCGHIIELAVVNNCATR
jgi:hypothetical protein